MGIKLVVIILFAGIAIGSAGMYFIMNNLPFQENNITIIGLNEPAQTDEKNDSSLLITNNIKYNLLNTKESEFGVNGEKPLEGGIFAISEIEIENLGKNEIIIYGNSWFVKDSQERIYKPKSYDTNSEDNENIFSIRIPPGFTVTKKIGFEIPNDSNSVQLFVSNGPTKEAEPILFTRII